MVFSILLIVMEEIRSKGLFIFFQKKEILKFSIYKFFHNNKFLTKLILNLSNYYYINKSNLFNINQNKN